MLGIKLVKSYSIVMNNFYDNLASVRLLTYFANSSLNSKVKVEGLQLISKY